MWRGEYQHLRKKFTETPPQYQFHLPEVAYRLYKSYLKSYFSRHYLRGYYMSIFLLIKIASLGHKYRLRLVNDYFRAYERKHRVIQGLIIKSYFDKVAKDEL